MIISISIWQCLVEVCFNVILLGSLSLFRGQDLLKDRLIILSLIFFNSVVFPSFYLLADKQFRNTVFEKGASKAIWLALKQKYD